MPSPEFDSPAEWNLHMQISADYLRIEQMEADSAYAIWARNAYVGIWLPDTQGFLISRYKLATTPFLFVEHHWDIGEPFGTAKPLCKLSMGPFSVGPKGEIQDAQQRTDMCKWLDDLETSYPPLAGWDSVGERRQAAVAWVHRTNDRNKSR